MSGGPFTVCTVLEMLASYDQLNVLNCGSAEQIARFLLMIKRGVKRGPRSPDVEEMEDFLVSDFDHTGGVRAQDFEKYVAVS